MLLNPTKQSLKFHATKIINTSQDFFHESNRVKSVISVKKRNYTVELRQSKLPSI